MLYSRKFAIDWSSSWAKGGRVCVSEQPSPRVLGGIALLLAPLTFVAGFAHDIERGGRAISQLVGGAI
jgi:hypothetical protein